MHKMCNNIEEKKLPRHKWTDVLELTAIHNNAEILHIPHESLIHL